MSRRASVRRYAALLRGVNPMNASMPALKQCFEAAGFTDVKTVLASGNVLFSSREQPEAEIAQACEAAMAQHLERSFSTIVRAVDELRALLAADPFDGLGLPPQAKRVVTFLRTAPSQVPELPVLHEDAAILAVHGREVYSAYIPGPKGPVFMALIEKTFGKDVTTRTWDTVRKLAR